MLIPCAKTRCVNICFFGLETVETPDECQFEVVGHVAHFHPIVLTAFVDGHRRRPTVEYVVGFQIKFATMLSAEFPFHSGINFPHGRQIGYTLQRGRYVGEIDRQRDRTVLTEF